MHDQKIQDPAARINESGAGTITAAGPDGAGELAPLPPGLVAVLGYRATDGRYFEDLGAARSHQELLNRADVISKFKQSLPVPPISWSVERLVDEWEAWKARHDAA